MIKQITYRILAAALLLASSISVSAESRCGVMAGAELSNLAFKQQLVDVNKRCGFDLGVHLENSFPGIGFGVSTGLLYRMSGAKVNLGQKMIWSSQGYGDENVVLHNLQVPLHLQFKWTRMQGLEDYVAPLVYAGPTIDFTVGHSKIDAISFTAANIGLEMGFGLEVKKNLQISAVRNWGMTYTLKTKLLDDYSARNRSWSVRVVYFWKH